MLPLNHATIASTMELFHLITLNRQLWLHTHSIGSYFAAERLCEPLTDRDLIGKITINCTEAKQKVQYEAAEKKPGV